MVEPQFSKLLVAGSSPALRSSPEKDRRAQQLHTATTPGGDTHQQRVCTVGRGMDGRKGEKVVDRKPERIHLFRVAGSRLTADSDRPTHNFALSVPLAFAIGSDTERVFYL